MFTLTRQEVKFGSFIPHLFCMHLSFSAAYEKNDSGQNQFISKLKYINVTFDLNQAVVLWEKQCMSMETNTDHNAVSCWYEQH